MVRTSPHGGGNISASIPLISHTLGGWPQKPSNFVVVAAEIHRCFLSFIMLRSPELTCCWKVQCGICICRLCTVLSPDFCRFFNLHLILVEYVIIYNVIWQLWSRTSFIYLAKTYQALSASLVYVSVIPSDRALFCVWELLAVKIHKGTHLMSWLFATGQSCFVPKKSVISFPLRVGCLSYCKIQWRPSSLYTNFGEKEKTLLYFDWRLTVIESEPQWFLLIPSVGSSKPLSKKRKR